MQVLSDVTFALDLKAFLAALAAAVLFYYLWIWRKKFAEPFLYFSDVKALQRETIRARQAELPKGLQLLSFILFIMAFADPHLFIERHQGDQNGGAYKQPTEGIAIYLILDQSGSMAEPVLGKKGFITKFDLLKQVTKQFIAGDPESGLKGHPNDLIGLVAFARGALVKSPLTLDHASLLSELSTFSPVGKTDQDGTSIGYAIFKTANMIAATQYYASQLIDKGEPAYTIKSTVMILITDGLQDPNPLDKGKRLRNMDIPEAAAYAKDQGIRLYIVNVDPKMATEEFAPHHHIMHRAAKLTGGKFYMVDGRTDLEGIYRDINQLEKSELPEELDRLDKEQRPDLYRRVAFYPSLIGIGLFTLLVSLILESTLFRRVP